MFNTQILDVAIGLVFVYLLLSLICSAVNEIIETALKKRAIDLERGIRELLVPGSPSGAQDLVRDIYNHPLVNNLFGKRYEDSRIGSKVRYVWRTKLPSYIPSRSFALALMDAILPAQPAPGAPGAVPPAVPPAASPSGAAGASPAKFEVKLDAIPSTPPPPTTGGNPLQPFRNAVANTPLLANAPQAQRALLGLVDAAGNDVAQARQNIEDWFNASMERVAGWYKRRAQLFILIIGFVAAVLMNADSVAIVTALNSDRDLREVVVAQAIKYADEAAKPTPTPTPPQETTKSTPKPTPTPKVPLQGTTTSTPTPTPTPTPAPTPTGSPSASPTPAPECPPACKDGKDKDSAECRLKVNKCQLQDLGLPIGWSSTDDPKRQMPKSLDDVGMQIYYHLFGWLLTAIAISLGAPFWFDLLNKFIVIRGTVKPKEKSLEEKSKD